MRNHPPVRTRNELHTLDESEILIGYMDGFVGEPSPGTRQSPSYYHGWRSGMVDGGWLQPDADQIALARDLESSASAISKKNPAAQPSPKTPGSSREPVRAPETLLS